MRASATFLLCLAFAGAYAQGLMIRPGTNFITTSGVVIVSNNSNIVNNGNGDLSGAHLVFVGSSASTIGGTGIITVRNLNVNKPFGSLVLQSHMSVNGQLNLTKGMIDLNAQRINLSSTSTVTGEAEWDRIIGSGDISITVNLNAPSAVNPGNLGLVISSFANLGATTIRRGHAVLTTNAIKRSFEIIPANNFNLGASIRFQYFDSELNNQNENVLTLMKKVNNSFISLGNDGSNSSLNFLGKNNLNELGIFTLAGPSNSLPVKFTLFNSSCEVDGTKLIWKTSVEINSKKFDIERSVDGLNWQVAGSVPTAGNSSVEKTYTYTDNAVSNALYRIVQYDINGQRAYTPVIRTSCAVAEESKVWPNPVVSVANISLKAIQGGDATITVIDSKGAVVQKTRNSILAGMNQLMIDMSKLAAGAYTVSVKWGNNLKEVRIIK